MSNVFGVPKNVAKPAVSAAVGSAVFSLAYPQGGIVWAPTVPKAVTDVIGPGLGKYATGALLGATSSVVCDNVANMFDFSKDASMAGCMAASAGAHLVVAGTLNAGGAGNQDEMMKLAATGAASALISEYVYAQLEGGPEGMEF